MSLEGRPIKYVPHTKKGQETIVRYLTPCDVETRQYLEAAIPLDYEEIDITCFRRLYSKDRKKYIKVKKDTIIVTAAPDLPHKGNRKKKDVAEEDEQPEEDDTGSMKTQPSPLDLENRYKQMIHNQQEVINKQREKLTRYQTVVDHLETVVGRQLTRISQLQVQVQNMGTTIIQQNHDLASFAPPPVTSIQESKEEE